MLSWVIAMPEVGAMVGKGYGGGQVSAVPIGVEEALRIGKQTARIYVPRIIHVDWETVHILIGVASHVAWRELAKRYKQIRLRGHFDEHKKLTGAIMKAWCWEIVSRQL